MHAVRWTLAASVLGFVALTPAQARAGATTPLSSLASLPRAAALKIPESPTSVPGLALESKDSPNATRWLELRATTTRGYCIQSVDGGMAWSGSRGSSSRSSAQDFDLVRLVDGAEKVTLERTRVHFDPPSGTLTAMGRSAVELKELARTAAGIVVWAYRDGKDVVVMARNVERGVESPRSSRGSGDAPFVSSDGCPFAGARLDARRPAAGSVAQIAGRLVARGKGKDKTVPRFIIDASLSHVSRDPEAMISVRVRTHETQR